MDRNTKVLYAFLLIFLFSFCRIPTAEGVEFQSGLSLPDVSCMCPPSDKWEFGMQPELWYVNTELNYPDGNHNVEGLMPGISIYSTKKYSKGSLTIFAGLRYGEFDSDGHYNSSSGKTNHFSGDISLTQFESKARWFFRKKWFNACHYIVGGISYTAVNEDHRSFSPGWLYDASGTNHFDGVEIYWSPNIGHGLNFKFFNKLYLRYEISINASLGIEKIKNARSGYKKDNSVGFGGSFLMTVLYQINDSINVQAGFRSEGFNQLFVGDDAIKFAYSGLFLRAGIIF